MQQLDVHADEEALELEVEVEQLLREQEAEAGKQVPVERLCQPDGRRVSSGVAEENKEPQEHTASPQADTPGRHCSSTPLRPDCPAGGAENSSAVVAT